MVCSDHWRPGPVCRRGRDSQTRSTVRRTMWTAPPRGSLTWRTGGRRCDLVVVPRTYPGWWGLSAGAESRRRTGVVATGRSRYHDSEDRHWEPPGQETPYRYLEGDMRTERARSRWGWFGVQTDGRPWTSTVESFAGTGADPGTVRDDGTTEGSDRGLLARGRGLRTGRSLPGAPWGFGPPSLSLSSEET